METHLASWKELWGAWEAVAHSTAFDHLPIYYRRSLTEAFYKEDQTHFSRLWEELSYYHPGHAGRLLGLAPSSKPDTHLHERPLTVYDLNSLAAAASAGAIREAFAHGLPITVVEEGAIVRKYPDGRSEPLYK